MKAKPIESHRLANRVLGDVTVTIYSRGSETALVLQHQTDVMDAMVPVRVQSACAYGEVLLSTSCDCRDQLEEAYDVFLRHGSGVLIYLDQEGRGAGLMAKARAYALEQTLGFDTVDAYEHLQIPVDQRDYSIAIDVLRDMRIGRVALLTNNTNKIAQLRQGGVDVTRQPLKTVVTENNAAYLATKQQKLGHLLSLTPG